jgi:hypothetical protein
MLSRARTRRIVTAALVAAAVGPLGAASASASTVTLSDDTAADFSAGTPTEMARPDGSVEIARTLDDTFDGAALPGAWTSSPWSAGGGTTVAGGSMLVDGTRADSGVTAGPRSSLQFTATLGDQRSTHVGFATDFQVEPWALFSTKEAEGATVYARTSNGAGVATDTLVPGILSTDSHTYRIDWTATGFDYFVDDVPVATQAIPVTSQMRPQASNNAPAGGGVSVDSMILSTHKPTGTFTSRTLDAADARVTAVSFTATDATPAGTSVSYETRTGTTPTALAAATWTPLGSAGTVAAAARYLQYRATMTTSDAEATPRLDKVDVAFTIDDSAPKVSIAGVAVTGATASVTFSSDDDSATTKCKLDSASFANCASPAEFSGLGDGTHTITVQAADADGNVGSDARTFVVDTRAPVVTISNVAVSGGSATVTFGSDDAAAALRCNLDGGPFASCSSPAVFSRLAAGGHTVVVQATDARGNVGSATRTLTIASTPGGSSSTPAGTTPSGSVPSGTGSDVTGPWVRVSRSARVSRRGIAALRVSCPRAEDRCRVTVKLKRHGKWIGRKTLTVYGNTTRTFGLRLSKATRSALTVQRRFTVTAVVTARDASGNSRTTRTPVTLRAPALTGS